MARRPQKINVVVNKPSPDIVSKLVAEAQTDVIMGRIRRFPEEQRLPLLDLCLDEIRSQQMKQIKIS